METRDGIRVLFVDDNDILGASMGRWMTDAVGMRWLGWTDDLAAARRMLETGRPDVLLLDIDMPRQDTFAFLRWVAEEHPDTRVLMLSGHMRQEYVERALDDGASGYIVKDESLPTIVEFVRRAAAGEVVLSSTARSWVTGPV